MLFEKERIFCSLALNVEANKAGVIEKKKHEILMHFLTLLSNIQS